MDREAAEPAQEPVGKMIFEEFGLGDVAKRPRQTGANQYGVKVTLVIGDEQHSSVSRNVPQAKNLEVEAAGGDDPAKTLREFPEPGRVFRLFDRIVHITLAAKSYRGRLGKLAVAAKGPFLPFRKTEA